jgi:hypothetical protein
VEQRCARRELLGCSGGRSAIEQLARMTQGFNTPVPSGHVTDGGSTPSGAS